MIEFGWGGASETGPVRRKNQDCLLISDPMFVVADGMGGHQAGEVAALMAIETLALETHPRTVDELVEAVEAANTAIIERGESEVTMRGMGTTVCVLAGLDLPDQSMLGVVNVGDSRLYLSSDEGLTQITEDHSLVETLVRDGRLSRKEASVHPQRNILTRALGIDPKVLVDSWLLTAIVGDRYVICSDGLFNELSANEIHTILVETRDPDTAAHRLVDEACAAGGHDNVTVVVVDIVGIEQPTDPVEDRVSEFRPALPRVEKPAPAVVSERSLASRPLFTWRLGLFVASVVTVMAVLMVSVVVYARSGFFVGVDGTEVVIFKGRPDGVLWFDPTFEESVQVSVADLAPSDLDEVSDGVQFDSLDEAKQYGFELFVRAENQQP